MYPPPTMCQVGYMCRGVRSLCCMFVSIPHAVSGAPPGQPARLARYVLALIGMHTYCTPSCVSPPGYGTECIRVLHFLLFLRYVCVYCFCCTLRGAHWTGCVFCRHMGHFVKFSFYVVKRRLGEAGCTH